MKRLAFLVVVAAGCARPQATRPAPTPVLAAAVSRPTIVTEGSLEAKTEHGPEKLALDRLHVSATTAGDFAEMRAEHVFRNDAGETREGTFRFPMPAGAILVGLAMEIDGKLVDGELVEREKARKAYEQIVDQMLDPALLEWENGQTFKLRVFPIEAKASKRIVLRFLAPLERRPDGMYFAFQSERGTLALDGKAVPLTAGRADVRVADVADAVVERAKDAAYWSVRIRPDFMAPLPAPKRQALIVLCDRSRSMLEARALQKTTVGLLVDALGPDDRFTVITGDVNAHALPGGLHPRADRDAAQAFVDADEPDGASDLGKLASAARPAIDAARKEGLEPAVVYVGDGTATWGETRSAPLAEITRTALDGATMHVLLLGRSTDEPAARAVAAGAHGRVLRPRTEGDAKQAVADVVQARAHRRLDDVKLAGEGGLEVPTLVPSTIYEGEELVLVFRGTPAPNLRLVATEAGRPRELPIAVASARPAAHVGQRWAKQAIERLESEGSAARAKVIETSLEHGVMSKYTSFLVLESDEAYAKFDIQRRAAKASDLDGNERAASVTPDHLQPGDPEVRIPAPADAQSVVVVYPFGETKNATFEDGTWVSRFLVDRQTPDGTYQILVRITHADGRLEILELPYVVDTKQPNFDVTITKKRGGYEIRAKQRLSAEEIEAQAPGTDPVEARGKRLAHVLTDAKRVEVRTPDGQTLSLTHVKLGEFVGTWTPKGLQEGKLRLVAVDRALNERVLEVEVPR